MDRINLNSKYIITLQQLKDLSTSKSADASQKIVIDVLTQPYRPPSIISLILESMRDLISSLISEPEKKVK